MFACTFIGHRDFSSNYYDKLCFTIEKLILDNNVKVFYVGTKGAFDKAVYRALSDLKNKYSIKIIVVKAYLNEKTTDSYSPEETLFPCILEKTPLRYAINKRNIYMIKQSQYMICYLNHTFSNSYTFVKYAVSHKLEIVNIGSLDINSN